MFKKALPYGSLVHFPHRDFNLSFSLLSMYDPGSPLQPK